MDALVAVSHKSDVLTVHGFVLAPFTPNTSPHSQILYVNRRFVKQNAIFEAIGQICKRACHLQKISQTSLYKPGYLLNVTVKSEEYDVEGEPDKQTILFKHRKCIEGVVEGFLSAWKTFLSNELYLNLKSKAIPESATENVDVCPMDDLQKTTEIGITRMVEKRSFVLRPTIASKRIRLDSYPEKVMKEPNDREMIEKTMERNDGGEKRDGLSAPPFCKPVQRSIHRNPPIALRTNLSLDSKECEDLPTANIVVAASPSGPLPKGELEERSDKDSIHFCQPLRKNHGFHRKKILSLQMDDFEWNQERKPSRTFSKQIASASVTLHREIFNDIEIIGQLDSKFILIRSKTTLLAVDQHAADERIKLECYEKQLLESFRLNALAHRLPELSDFILSPHELQVRIFLDRFFLVHCCSDI